MSEQCDVPRNWQIYGVELAALIRRRRELPTKVGSFGGTVFLYRFEDGSEVIRAASLLYHPEDVGFADLRRLLLRPQHEEDGE